MWIKKGENALQIRELDVVALKDGRTATVIEVLSSGEAYLLEVTDDKGKTVEMPIVAESDIERVVWTSST